MKRGSTKRGPGDPVFRSARREALVALAAWAAACLYTVPASYLLGYNRPPEEVPVVFGMPLWVVAGVFLPWAACVVFAGWFALRFVRDEDLGAEPDDERSEGSDANEDGKGPADRAGGPGANR